MTEKGPENPPPGVRLRGAMLEAMRRRETGRRYIPEFKTAVTSIPHETGGEAEEPGDIERISLVFGNEIGPLAWLSEEVLAYRPTEPPEQFIGMMVVDDQARPGNQLRVAVFRPEQKRSVVTVTNAMLERTLVPLLPYPVPIGDGIADLYQMELYPSLQSLPDEIDFNATARSMLRQEREDDLRYPALIPLHAPPETTVPAARPEQGPDWRPLAAGLGLAVLATAYAISRQVGNRRQQ